MSHLFWSRVFSSNDVCSFPEFDPELVDPVLLGQEPFAQERLNEALAVLTEPFPSSLLPNGQDSACSIPLEVDVLRLDRLGSPIFRSTPLHVSGNKVFKLAGHIDAFFASSTSSLVSFGGRWSNHLHALAAVAQSLNIPSIGFVRGYPEQPLTATLQDCVDMGMTLKFCDKQTYAKRYDPDWRQALSEKYDAWVIPEGGEGEKGMVGFRALAPILKHYDHIWVTAGTGTSAQGIAAYLTPKQTLVVVNAVADQGELQRKWAASMMSSVACQWEIIDDAHQGGFGKCPPELRTLIASADAAGLPLDPVYTAKLVSAFLKRLTESVGHSAVKTLLIHTGGLQGRRGYDL
jgi:1-aminocyclopropane-1-carboxylate deaminase